jgi:hypothetical protein
MKSSLNDYTTGNITATQVTDSMGNRVLHFIRSVGLIKGWLKGEAQ